MIDVKATHRVEIYTLVVQQPLNVQCSADVAPHSVNHWGLCSWGVRAEVGLGLEVWTFGFGGLEDWPYGFGFGFGGLDLWL